MAISYDVQALPSLKILLHLAKHPHSTVIGLLVGVVEGDTVAISDAIPFVHHWLDLSPMLEAGLALAKIHVASKHLKLVGTYLAHARADLKGLDLVSRKLNESLGFDSSILLVVSLILLLSHYQWSGSHILTIWHTENQTDNQKLNTSENPFIPFTRTTKNENEWLPLDAYRFRADVPQNWLSSGGSIGDFDDHLEDIGIDWLVNPTVVPLATK